ncbi:rhomboid family intramembrane serine protease [Rhodoligotrophos defluvii]|uniref:rhomboid family intramembrane serine protease n=1 Tax=Rhodoligotrophos defluvii TaxID=2561934 RepID=UPI0010C96AF2|nr:rhomboid family intramembrane serine protease [Rhodoligotrophos defluvii]
MFVPLYDDNPLRVIRFQYVTGALVGLNLLIFLLTDWRLPAERYDAMVMGLGVIPSVITDQAVLSPDLALIPPSLTLLTYMFIHGGWMHLIGNMLFLWVFGDNIEDIMGSWRFLLFFLFCGVVAALAHVALVPDSNAPLIGASGAVAGVMAAYLVFYPRRRVWILLFLRIPLPMPASFVLIGWLLFQVLSIFVTVNDEVQIAWIAHISGFAVGAIIAYAVRRRWPVLAKG